MAKEEGTVTCPDCGAKFDVADRLRAHIEAEIRSGLQASARAEMEQELEARLSSEQKETERQQAALEKRLGKQTKELTSLRGAKVELTELKGTIEVEVKEAKAKAAADARKKFEDELEGLVDKRVEEESGKQQVLEHQITQQRKELNGLRKDKIKLANLEETREVELEEARAKAAREARKTLNQELDEKIAQRLKEETAERDLKIGRLELVLERQNSKIKELEEQTTARHGELEGEVLELAVVDTLRNLFPRDDINEVKRGAYGADAEHSVRNPVGATAGKIVWECKKHKRWHNDWVGTIRQNAADCNADTMVIVTTAMPDRMESFGRFEDVFICQYHELPIVAHLLRHAILKADIERIREEHMLTIQERVVEYVSGPEFALVMRSVIEAYQNFEDDLRREEQYMRKRWKARRGYLKNVIDSIMNMAGKLEQLGAGDYEVMLELGGEEPPINLLSKGEEPDE